MISVTEAISLIPIHAPQPAVLPLPMASGLRLADAVFTEVDSPAFDNSAMDGYAVGSSFGPWEVVGAVAAGEVGAALLAGEAARIFTGAPVPDGTYAVVAQEDVSIRDGHLYGPTATAGSHIRRRGEVARTGELLFPAGTRITPPVAQALAANGLPNVSIRPRPRFGLLSTGSELTPPGQPLPPAHIYESNSAGVGSILRSLGCEVCQSSCADDLGKLEEVVKHLLAGNDALVTIGGVSVGDFDFMRQVMDSLGFSVVISGVSMKPGKPFTLATRPDGKVWFGLPGNPMSAFVTCCLFVLPFFGEQLTFRPVPIGAPYSKKQGRDEFVPANVCSGTLHIKPTIGSHAALGLAEAHGLAWLEGDLEQGQATLYADFPWRWML